MSEENNDQQNISVSLPLGAVAATAVVALAAVVVYFITNREDGEVTDSIRGKAKAGKGIGKKLGLRTAITLLENDSTRKVVLAALRVMLRRS